MPPEYLKEYYDFDVQTDKVVEWDAKRGEYVTRLVARGGGGFIPATQTPYGEDAETGDAPEGGADAEGDAEGDGNGDSEGSEGESEGEGQESEGDGSDGDSEGESEGDSESEGEGESESESESEGEGDSESEGESGGEGGSSDGHPNAGQVWVRQCLEPWCEGGDEILTNGTVYYGTVKLTPNQVRSLRGGY